MSLWKIAWRSVQQRALASSLTGISMALGVMLVVAVLVAHGVIDQSFRNNSALGYNMVVGAKGGKLQLVLNTVYYLSSPVENIPYSYYKEFTEGKFKAWVDKAIPVCLGDYYQNYRVVGTTPAMFDSFEYANGKKYEFAEGANFKHEEFNTGVIGATVARNTGLKVGGKFAPTHSAPEGEAHEHDPFTVVGILKPTGTPNDRAVFVNIEGFYLIEGHAKPAPAGEAETSSSEAADAHAHEGHEHPEEADIASADPDPAEGAPADAEAVDPQSVDAERAAPGPSDAKPEGKPTAAQPQNAKPEDAKPAEEEHSHEEHAEGDHADHDHAAHEHEHGESGAHDHHGEDPHAHDHGGHGHHHHEPLPEEQREVTAILVRNNDLYTPSLVNTINEGPVAQAVLPVREITNLFALIVDPLRIVLLTLTVLIVVVSGIGILVSIYNSMSERRHEIAVMRSLGAGRRTVMLIVLLESILLSIGGGVLGWFLGHTLVAALAPWISDQTGVSLGFFQFVGYELVIIPALIALASLVGYLPAMAAYRTDVAKSLSAAP